MAERSLSSLGFLMDRPASQSGSLDSSSSLPAGSTWSEDRLAGFFLMVEEWWRGDLVEGLVESNAKSNSRSSMSLGGSLSSESDSDLKDDKLAL